MRNSRRTEAETVGTQEKETTKNMTVCEKCREMMHIDSGEFVTVSGEGENIEVESCKKCKIAYVTLGDYKVEGWNC